MTGLRAKLIKLILAQLVVLGTAVAGTNVYQSIITAREGQQLFEAQVRRTMTTKGRQLTRNQRIVLRSLLADYALSDMQNLVAGTVEADRELEYGIVTDSNGNALAFAASTALTGTTAGRPASESEAARLRMSLGLTSNGLPTAPDGRREFVALERRFIEFSAPISSEDARVAGVVRYGFSTRLMENELAQARVVRGRTLRQALLATGGVAVLALVLGLWLALRQSSRITEPLNDLTRAASELAQGNRAARVDIRSDDELQVLGDAFNAMVQDLSASYQRLEEANRKLSDEIAVREAAEAERRSAEQQLAQAQKMEAIGQLAGGVAHDFNNLLTVIQGNASLAAMALDTKGVAATTDLHHHLEEIERATDRAANLTRQLLAFSRRDEDKPSTVDMSEVVHGLMPMLRRLLRENIQVDVQLSTTPLFLQISPSRLEQVVMNLAINAGDAMPDGGELRISTRALTTTEARTTSQGAAPAGNYCVLSVSDTGKGVAPEHLAHIFEPFFTTKPVGKGTGLGLATVHGIVRRANGWIDVESQLDVGTSFALSFPRVASADSVAYRGVDSAPRGNGEWLLVCEDDPAVREITEAFLLQYGYRVAAFASPNAALEHVARERRPYAMLITDVVMPEMSGPELASGVGELVPNLPVLYVSGYTAGALNDYGIEEMSEHLLRKPFNGQELCGRVFRALRWREAKTA